MVPYRNGTCYNSKFYSVDFKTKSTFSFCRLEPVLENRLGGAADLGAGAVGGEVPEPHQVHGALQQHVLLDSHPHPQPARWKGNFGFDCVH